MALPDLGTQRVINGIPIHLICQIGDVVSIYISLAFNVGQMLLFILLGELLLFILLLELLLFTLLGELLWQPRFLWLCLFYTSPTRFLTWDKYHSFAIRYHLIVCNHELLIRSR